jgi:hypothetical protein
VVYRCPRDRGRMTYEQDPFESSHELACLTCGHRIYLVRDPQGALVPMTPLDYPTAEDGTPQRRRPSGPAIPTKAKIQHQLEAVA